MTRRIPPGAPRHRKERACLSCRSAKCKCVSSATIGDEKCERCERLGLDCVLVPSMRMGRPRRLAPRQPQMERSAASTGSDSDTAMGRATQPSRGACYPASSILAETAPPQEDEEFLKTTAERYLRFVHPFAPLLPSSLDTLLAALNRASPNLISAFSSITFPTDTHLRQRCTESWIAESPGNGATMKVSPLDDIRAMALMTHVLYGKGEQEKAIETIECASKRLIELNVHMMDRDLIVPQHVPPIPDVMDTFSPYSTLPTFDSHDTWWRNPPWSLLEATPTTPPTLLTTDEGSLEDWRRLFWEVLALEIMLASVTGVRSQLHLAVLIRPGEGDELCRCEGKEPNPCLVLYPGEAAWMRSRNSRSTEGIEFMSPYKLKIQALKLIGEAAAPPPCAMPDTLRSPSQECPGLGLISERERIRHITLRADAISTLAKQMWAEWSPRLNAAHQTKTRTRIQASPDLLKDIDPTLLNLGLNPRNEESYPARVDHDLDNDHECPLSLPDLLATAEACFLSILVVNASIIYLHGSATCLSAFFICGIDPTSDLRHGDGNIDVTGDGDIHQHNPDTGGGGVCAPVAAILAASRAEPPIGFGTIRDDAYAGREDEWACVRGACESIWDALKEDERIAAGVHAPGDDADGVGGEDEVSMSVSPMMARMRAGDVGTGLAHGPFFGCSVLVAAHGSLLLLEKDLELSASASASIPAPDPAPTLCQRGHPTLTPAPFARRDRDHEKELKQSAATLIGHLQLASRILRTQGKKWVNMKKTTVEIGRVVERAGAAYWKAGFQ